MTIQFAALGRTAFSLLAALSSAAVLVAAAVPVIPIA